MIADRAYDSDPLRRRLKKRGIELIAPYRKNNRERRYEDGRKLRRYKRRWIVERTNAWLGQFRRLLVRHEHLLSTSMPSSTSPASGLLSGGIFETRSRDRWVRCDLRFPGRCSRDVRLHGVLLRKLLKLRRSQQCVLFDVVAIYGGSSAGVGDGRCRVLGSHLCDALLAENHSIVCADNLLTGRMQNIEHLASKGRFEFLNQDVSHPLTCHVDYVFHFASPASPIDYLQHGIETLQAGSNGTINCLEVAKKNRAKFFLASTSECYGDPLEHPQSEDYWGHVNPVGPRSVYDESKRFAEAVTMAYHRYHELDTHIVRIFNTYGPRLQINDGRVISNFMKQALRDEDLTVYDGLPDT